MRFTVLFILSFVLLLSVAAALVSAACRDVTVQNLRIFVDGQEYWVKGMNYDPTPSQAPKNAGICANDACKSRDFFDKPFAAFWDRDFAKMNDLGVNTVRIHTMNPYDKNGYAAKFPNSAKGKRISDHLGFFDKAKSSGIKVIAPLMDDAPLVLNASKEELQRLVEGRVDALGNHDALLMWTVGDGDRGWDFGNSALRERANWIMFYGRKYMLSKHGRAVPITAIIRDDPAQFALLENGSLSVDVIMANVQYQRGEAVSYNSLWDSSVRALVQKLNRPFLHSRFGVPNIEGKIVGRPSVMNEIYKEVVEFLALGPGAIGGCYMNYADDASNALGTRPAQEQHGGVVEFSANAGNADLDNANNKAWLYDYLKSGYSGSQWSSFNFHSEVWNLMEGHWKPSPRQSIDANTCKPDAWQPKIGAPMGFDPQPLAAEKEEPGPGTSTGGSGGTGGTGGGTGGGGSGGTGGGGSNGAIELATAVVTLLLASVAFVFAQ